MDRKLTIFVLYLLSLALFLKFNSIEVQASDAMKTSPAEEIVSRKLDKQARILQKYLQKFDSPMQNHAQDFIDAAKTYDLDWKMLPAIAGVESTFGKQIPGGYNAYGWGVYGTQAIYFTSWTDGIYTVARGLREGYLNKGLTEPYAINRVYAASPHWGKNVTFFMNDLEKFAAQYTDLGREDLSQISNEPKIAAISASIASHIEPVIR